MESLLEILKTPWYFFTFIALMGLSVGSFLNVVIVRLPNQILNPAESSSILWPGSACLYCKNPIQFFDNIPVLSFLVLKGRCRHCETKIAWTYPIVEIITCFISLIVAWHFEYSKSLIPALLLSWSLITLSVIDLKHFLLPDNITLPGLWLGLFINCFSVFQTAESAILGAIFGYLILWIIYWFFKAVTGKNGMGYGDFKLMSLLGAWLGWQMLPVIILLSSFLGSSIGLYLILIKKQDKSQPLPFGPMIAVAGWIVLLYGSKLNALYLNLFNY